MKMLRLHRNIQFLVFLLTLVVVHGYLLPNTPRVCEPHRKGSVLERRHYQYSSAILKDIHRIQLQSHENSQLGSSTNSMPPVTTATTTTNNVATNLINKATNLFPFWVLSFSLLGFYFPFLFQWFLPFITPALMFTMLGMGMTLTINDFQRVLSSWQYILVGFLAQYLIMPLSAYTVTKLFPLNPDIAAGLILVGCAPGGTASNLVTLIAKGDIPLSILMTTVSTIAAVFMTPLLVTKLIGKSIQLNSLDLVYSTMNVVLLPVLAGLFINTKFSQISLKISEITPLLSVLLVACICGSISSVNRSILKQINSFQLIASIFLLHTIGFGVGYVFAKIFQANENQSRTISIETGMQNSALAVVLAKHFPNPVLSALPGAISATCHSLLGSTLAALWRIYDDSNKKKVKKFRIQAGPYI